MEKLGFAWTNDIVALITLAFGLLYLYIGDGYGAFVKTYSNKNKIKD